MTAIDLLEATRDRMGREGSDLPQALFKTWTNFEPRLSVTCWNEAARAVASYFDRDAVISNCHLYGFICARCSGATFHTQLDAIDVGIQRLKNLGVHLGNVIDPRD